MTLGIQRNYDDVELVLRELLVCLITRRQTHGQQGLGLTECTREVEAIERARALLKFNETAPRGSKGGW